MEVKRLPAGEYEIDGNIIKPSELTTESLTPDVVNALSQSQASLYDIVLIRNGQHKLANDMENLFGNIEMKIDEGFKNHPALCPANPDEINQLITDKIAEVKENDKKERKLIFSNHIGVTAVIVAIVNGVLAGLYYIGRLILNK